MLWGRDDVSHALQLAVRAQCGLNETINYPTTSQNYKLTEIWLTAFKTQLDSTVCLFQYEGPFFASKTLVCDAAILWKSDEGVYHDCDKKQAAPERSSACSGPRGLSCIPYQKPTLLWFTNMSYERSLHHGLFIKVGIQCLMAAFIFQGIKVSKSMWNG